MSRGPRTTSEQIEQARSLRLTMTGKEVAKEMGRSEAWVSRYAPGAKTPSQPESPDSSIAASPESATTEQPA